MSRKINGNRVLKFFNTGNVGIGTATPANTQGLSVLGGASLGSYATTAAPAGGLIVSGNVGIGTTGPQGAFVVTNGNVGIGTFAPTNGFVYNNCAAHSGQAACWAANGPRDIVPA